MIYILDFRAKYAVLLRLADHGFEGYTSDALGTGGEMGATALLPNETRKYFETHPEVAEQLRRAERVYKTFGQYLMLTQSRVIVRESGASTAEAELSATLSRTDL